MERFAPLAALLSGLGEGPAVGAAPAGGTGPPRTSRFGTGVGRGPGPWGLRLETRPQTMASLPFLAAPRGASASPGSPRGSVRDSPPVLRVAALCAVGPACRGPAGVPSLWAAPSHGPPSRPHEAGRPPRRTSLPPLLPAASDPGLHSPFSSASLQDTTEPPVLSSPLLGRPRSPARGPQGQQRTAPPPAPVTPGAASRGPRPQRDSQVQSSAPTSSSVPSLPPAVCPGPQSPWPRRPLLPSRVVSSSLPSPL